MYSKQEPKLSDLLARITVDNDEDAREELVRYFMPIASNIAMKFSRSTSMEYEELRGEALLALVIAVSRLNTLLHDNIGGFIYTYMSKACQEYIRHNITPTEPLVKEPTDYRYFDQVMLKDQLESIVRSDLDSNIISLRLQGLRDKQIGERLGYSTQYIWQQRMSLLERYDKCVSSFRG